MQSRLPDINTAFIKYRTECIIAIKNKNWSSAHGCIVSINGLLPEEYVVRVDSIEYNKLNHTEIIYECRRCKQQQGIEKITIYNLIPNGIETLLFSPIAEKVWNCIKCKFINKLTQTVVMKNVMPSPFFYGVIPEAPERRGGLMDRLKFNIEIERWMWLALGESEAKMAKFRDDNWGRGDETGEVNTDLEEKDASN